MLYSEARACAAIWTLGDALDSGTGSAWERWIGGQLPTSEFLRTGRVARRTLAVCMSSDSRAKIGDGGIYEARLWAALRTLAPQPDEWIAWVAGRATNAMFLFRDESPRQKAASIAGDYYGLPSWMDDEGDEIGE